MKVATKDFVREPGAGALTSADTNALAQYKAARSKRNELESKVVSLEERINRLEQLAGIK